jgi:hypothetical protein
MSLILILVQGEFAKTTRKLCYSIGDYTGAKGNILTKKFLSRAKILFYYCFIRINRIIEPCLWSRFQTCDR